MKNLTTFRDAGSVIAGLLIGLSIVVTVFAVADPGGVKTVLGMVAPIALALGIVLQALVTRPAQATAHERFGPCSLAIAIEGGDGRQEG
jgi:hypothetical protein